VTDKNDSAQADNWIINTGLLGFLEACALKLDDMHTSVSLASEAHGAAYLGSYCIRAFRQVLSATGDPKTLSAGTCWILSARIVYALGKGVMHPDETAGITCSHCIGIAFDHDTIDAPVLEEQLYTPVSYALDQCHSSLSRYGGSDHLNSNRCSSTAEAAGLLLAASTSASGCSNDSPLGIGPNRLKCVDGLFALLGSASSRKDPVISLIAGEALAKFADAYSPVGAVWTSPLIEPSSAYDEIYARELPPHSHVSKFWLPFYMFLHLSFSL